ncbi:MAG TPA: hypothetical protein PLM18_08435 [Sedimentibacter sp.]|nr:hypothetical protein [Sedimentibacter sp.]
MPKDNISFTPRMYSIKGYSKNGRGFFRTLLKIIYGLAIALLIGIIALFIYFSF